MENKKNWFANYYGKKLIDVKASIFVFEGVKYKIHPLDLILYFESEKPISLSTDVTKEEICLSKDTNYEVDMSEYGSCVLASFSHQDLWKKLIGKKLYDIQIVISGYNHNELGLSLIFENNLQVSIMAGGDEMYIYEEIPDDWIRTEKLFFR